ncbi:hypothetical protein [Agrobacterium sp. NPDC089420]|uniref:hypothetical protein n=1 Tax=Agrobacterium sp. NPDC089420 TaxID=3363918 RepID=UPI00384D9E19
MSPAFSFWGAFSREITSPLRLASSVLASWPFSAVMPDLIRHPADARLRGEKDFFQPNDLGWLDTGSRPV